MPLFDLIYLIIPIYNSSCSSKYLQIHLQYPRTYVRTISPVQDLIAVIYYVLKNRILLAWLQIFRIKNPCIYLLMQPSHFFQVVWFLRIFSFLLLTVYSAHIIRELVGTNGIRGNYRKDQVQLSLWNLVVRKPIDRTRHHLYYCRTLSEHGDICSFLMNILSLEFLCLNRHALNPCWKCPDFGGIY